MEENSNISPNPKETTYYISNPLTPQEIESFRKEIADSFRILEELSEEEFQKNEALRIVENEP